MKGIIFTEFLTMMETDYSPMLMEEAIEEAELGSGGCYTAVGTYDHAEMVSLLRVLSDKTGLTIPVLLRRYGEFLFARFVLLYPAFFRDTTSAFDFLAAIESHIHKEVRKLYSDAQLPSFHVEDHASERFCMIYTSERGLGDLCEGLIVGCLRHFGEEASITRTDLESAHGSRVRFLLEK